MKKIFVLVFVLLVLKSEGQVLSMREQAKVMDELLAGELSAWQRERVLAIRLLALGRMNIDVAEVVGRLPKTMANWRTSYLSRGVEWIQRRPGGRRNQLMDEESEREFVASFLEAAARGEMVTVSSFHEALSERVGHDVWPATVYRMLDRHGWRKIAPRPTHPKADPAARAAFKQTSRRS